MAFKTWLIFLGVAAHFASATAQVEAAAYQTNYTRCTNNANYSTQYKDDVTTLLRSLSSNINDTGFHSAIVGGAYGAALCRADIQLDTCRGCIANETDDILAGPCSNKSRAIMWNNLCMVRFSNQPIFGKLDKEPHANNSNNLAFNFPQPVVDVRKMLVKDLRFKAANGGFLRKAAADNRTSPEGETVVYAMVQCTPDLSPEDCADCTADAVVQISDFSLPWLLFYKPSCTIRVGYEPFVNLTRLEELLEQVNGSSPAGNSGRGKDHKTRNIIIIVISIVVFLSAAFYVGLSARQRMKKKRKGQRMKQKRNGQRMKQKRNGQTTKNDDQISSIESIQYDFGKIKAATNNFDDANKLGQGAFGTVYKGILENDRKIVVKRLSEHSWQGDQEFKNEVLLLAKLQHKNLVRLLGFSLEEKEKLLVYEFVQNGSLDHFIFDRVKSSSLDWDKRHKIIEGVARGLVYLHEDSRLQIIHRDLKAGNVLLDEDLKPKISDFELAILVALDVSRDRTSRIIGTPGYMAPEYKSDGKFSIKSDVYSFGILVLEIVTGKKIESYPDFISDTWRSWREDVSVNIIDPDLRARSDEEEHMKRCIHIALWCIQESADKRPRMVEVVQTLNSASQTLSTPSEPGFYIRSRFTEDSVSSDI